MVSLDFFINIILLTTLAMVVTKPLDGNEYQQYFLEGKGIGLVTLPPSCADCFEIWEFEPLGTLRASPGN